MTIKSGIISAFILAIVLMTGCSSKGPLAKHPQGCTQEAAYAAGKYDGERNLPRRNNYGDDCKKKMGDLSGGYNQGYNDGQDKRNRHGAFGSSSSSSSVTRTHRGRFHKHPKSTTVNRSSTTTSKGNITADKIDKESAKKKYQQKQDN